MTNELDAPTKLLYIKSLHCVNKTACGLRALPTSCEENGLYKLLTHADLLMIYYSYLQWSNKKMYLKQLL